MSAMFYNATNFNQDISGWNVSEVRLMNGMFYNASSFNYNLKNWNVSNVNNVYGMFTGSGLTLSGGLLFDMSNQVLDWHDTSGVNSQELWDALW